MKSYLIRLNMNNSKYDYKVTILIANEDYANIIILGYIAYQQSAVNEECKATCFVVTILWTPASFGVMLAHRLRFPHSNHVV